MTDQERILRLEAAMAESEAGRSRLQRTKDRMDFRTAQIGAHQLGEEQPLLGGPSSGSKSGGPLADAAIEEVDAT